MNAAQTRAEVNHQIGMLMQNCSPEEQKQLKKYLKPIHESAQAEVVRQGEPVHISEVLHDVMDDIQQLCERNGKRNAEEMGR